MMNPAAMAEHYRRFKEELLADNPDLSDDDRALLDTLEGVSDLPDFVANIIRNARRKEALASGIKAIVSDNKAREARLLASADKCRRFAQHLMSEAGLPRIEQPDFTASIRNVPPKVEITDEAVIEDRFVKVTRTPDKTAIKEALRRGENVSGAVLGNGSATLFISTR